MDLKKVKQIYAKIKAGGLDKSYWFGDEYEEYCIATNKDDECGFWYLRTQTKEAGINYKRYCCVDMAYRMIEHKKEIKSGKFDVDCIIRYDKSHKEYGIPIHDGGSSYISIKYCPWCGKELKSPGAYNKNTKI